MRCQVVTSGGLGQAVVISTWLLQMLAWALLLIVPAVFLRAIDPLPPHAHGWQRFGKALGVIMLLLGAGMVYYFRRKKWL